jgi:hypothetical protein
MLGLILEGQGGMKILTSRAGPVALMDESQSALQQSGSRRDPR